MSSQTKVPWNTRLGAIGESEIESRLRYFSNPIKYSIDVGLDFYCELLENDSPSLPFYVQAKGTQHFDEMWGQGIRISTIIYWLGQSSPVFLVVYDENDKTCYWMSIEDRRHNLLNQLGTQSETIYIRIDKTHILERGKDANAEFINKIKEDMRSVEMWRGVARPKGEGYVKQIPGPPRSPAELIHLKETTRMNMYSLIQYYSANNEPERAYDLCSFLAKFDKSHYNHFMWLGDLEKQFGRKELARESYKEALDICERDKKWPRESMEKLKESIKRAMVGL